MEQEASKSSAAGQGRAVLSPDAFAAECQRARPVFLLLALAMLGDRALAEDVVQEAMVTGLGRLSSFEPGTSLVAWMSQIVRNLALNAQRSRTRRRTFATSNETLAERPAGGKERERRVLTATGDLAGDQREFDDRLVAALMSLDHVQRTCLLLRTVGELPYSKIALVAGVPEGTAMSHVHRARRVLRERLTEGAGTAAGGASPGAPKIPSSGNEASA